MHLIARCARAGFPFMRLISRHLFDHTPRRLAAAPHASARVRSRFDRLWRERAEYPKLPMTTARPFADPTRGGLVCEMLDDVNYSTKALWRGDVAIWAPFS